MDYFSKKKNEKHFHVSVVQNVYICCAINILYDISLRDILFAQQSFQKKKKIEQQC
jgi:hypothetical protein